jgi:hypothetical protein
MSETKAITYTESREAFFVKKLKKAERGLDNLMRYGTDPDSCVKSGEEVSFYRDALAALREQAERESAKRFNVQADMFGEYCLVPTGYSGEKHIYKIVSHFRSNSYCETPLMHDSKPTLHESIADVLNVIHCGLDETKVERVALSNVELCGKRLEVKLG